jgi:hypothetical protein
MAPSHRFQIISDLHLETPLLSPSYTTFTLPIHAPHLFLLGDIGQTTHPQLFYFLSTLLAEHTSLTIYYLLGNHEAYTTTLDVAIQRLEAYETETKHTFPGPQRFYFLNRTRVDIEPNVTILGCTLWTHIPAPDAHACATLLTDFSERNGIWDRSVEQHNDDHVTDLSWLNSTVSSIPPDRDIIVLTHHSPTLDPRANNARHAKSSANAGFRTDLSGEVCWVDERVKLWGFGHTHFNCQYVDGRGKLVLANQRGYGGRKADVVVVEAGEEKWRVVVGEKESRVRDRGGLGDRQGEESMQDDRRFTSSEDQNAVGDSQKRYSEKHKLDIRGTQQDSKRGTVAAKIKYMLRKK